MNTKILLVEPSSTMRHVLKNYVADAGHEVETHSTYAEAATALKQQFDQFDTEYGCLLMGWPAVRDRESTRLLGMLEGVDFHDLPVIVLSQDMRADTRAWVAARDHCVLLRWKDYRSVTELLEKVLEQELDTDTDVFRTKFSNEDIRILVVDDSASIRLALRDLLQLHGYQVVVVGNFADARVAARAQRFDIALLDYYLQDTTGDELCRALLDDDVGEELVCAILTGTYSDHIIKRSLRAGAIECLFKNESSELLLARVDALSRLVRQRKKLTQQHQDMDALIDAIGGAVIVFDSAGVITYANGSALQILGHVADFTLLGQRVGDVVSAELLQAEHGKRLNGQFRVFDHEPLNVLYKCSEFNRGPGGISTIVVFRTLDQLSGASTAPTEQSQQTLFLKVLSDSIEQQSVHGEMLTLLMLDIGFVDLDKKYRSIAEAPAAVHQMSTSLQQVYRRRNHVAYLGDSKFVILLRHTSEAQAYLLSRKIMQISNDIGKQTRLGDFSCNGAVLSVDQNSGLSEAEMLRRARQGLKLVEARGRNNALLLDLKRMLPVYPKNR